MELNTDRGELIEINAWKIRPATKTTCQLKQKMVQFSPEKIMENIYSNIFCRFSVIIIRLRANPFIFDEYSLPVWGWNALYCHVKSEHFHHIRKTMEEKKTPTLSNENQK